MTDIEKVKTGLSCCQLSMSNDYPFVKCSVCPYNTTVDVEDCRAVLSKEALEVIEELETK